MEDRIARELSLDLRNVKATLSLLNDGNTVPFIARYRKEATGGLDEVQIRDIARVSADLKALEDRRAYILKSIEDQGKLNVELKKSLASADSIERLEDLYAPFKPRRITRAKKAIEAGLEPVANAIKADREFQSLAKQHVCDDYPDAQAVIEGARDIIAEEISDDADIRDYSRTNARKYGRLIAKKRRGAEPDPKYEMYYEFTSPISRTRPHQVLAIRRAEAEKVLSAGLEVDEERLVEWISRHVNRARGPARRIMDEAAADAFKRLIHPTIERDLRGEVEKAADEHAISVFGVNLKNLLLQPPLVGKRVLGVDPGMRTGCKLAAVDATGKLLGTGQIYVHDGRAVNAPKELQDVIRKFQIDIVAIGNGTGSRETEEVVAKAVSNGVQYLVVDEAGASVYSASDVARQEFPDLDVSVRGAVSIARRVQDPLAELVKIDPKSIGVGMYQHDVNQNRLQDSLDAVVEDVVNNVGVDLNSASESLLARVAGIGPVLASRIVAHRNENGPFKSRADLKKVKGLGAKTFEQCAGFLRIRDGKEPLDWTGIHPENYGFAKAVLKALKLEFASSTLEKTLADPSPETRAAVMKLAEEHGVGPLTLRDVMEALIRPGRDPREELDAPQLRSDVMSMDDLRVGMRLKGTVRNVVDFGAFVDIGVKQDGLVHVSEMADHFVKNPYEVLSIGQVVDVKISAIDAKRGRIGLSMKS